ncbi:low molecular weight protein-tyrosine-phosphatase [Nocardioides sp. HM23]|uniref:low molecular weight protein-tyrosine-phosphatase n=1 Tax=Nocardioides bizhenqiangii TaxID=3095076 RepID=UPI002ACA8BCE|nr:low molecular weight protein-tyrosine-phosphatase [Nocardioides sp. HM23]MDZ5619781.1 low molecular weight protein-tyrosine-phosphatase [Nocardioides sp. HM23]
MPALPPPRTPGRYRIALVCLGNICRSPMADVVLTERVAAAGLADKVSVVSSGTGDWHVGHPMDRRAAALLTSEGYDASAHRAQQVAPSWLTAHDLLLAMDRQNLRDLHALADGDVDPDRVRLFGDFDPVEPGAEVPDPYYGGDDGFHDVLAMIERTADALVDALVLDYR